MGKQIAACSWCLKIGIDDLVNESKKGYRNDYAQTVRLVRRTLLFMRLPSLSQSENARSRPSVRRTQLFISFGLLIIAFASLPRQIVKYASLVVNFSSL